MAILVVQEFEFYLCMNNILRFIKVQPLSKAIPLRDYARILGLYIKYFTLIYVFIIKYKLRLNNELNN